MSESLIQLIPKEERAKIAFQILKNASFGERFAETIVFVGHCSTHANHTQFAGLQCGACGGHGGGVNARIAAELLNNKSVREELREMGYSLPDSTIFLSGVHDTTLENIQLHSSSDLDGDKIRDLQELFEQASRKVQAGRNSQEIPSEAKRRKSFLRKSQDWSETRPEWGLARNAAFLAARRSRTRLVDLEGRVFLHEYDSERDPDGSVLSLILSAPVVVASWINLQYYASTVDNRRFGTGSKTLHNRVGEVGVVSGNGGDLRTGLSEQSVYDTSGEWYHEPLRLQVIVEAPLEKVQTALLGQKNVLDLVANEWIRLFALERESTRLHPVLAVTER